MNSHAIAIARKARINAVRTNTGFEPGDLVQHKAHPFAEPGVVVGTHGRHGVDVQWVDGTRTRTTRFDGNNLVQA